MFALKYSNPGLVQKLWGRSFAPYYPVLDEGLFNVTIKKQKLFMASEPYLRQLKTYLQGQLLRPFTR
jgi:hypothetical protein